MPAAGYQGIYVEVDPYAVADANNTVGLAFLQNAAQTACSGTVSEYTVFCNNSVGQIANGIFLQIPWCNWELDSTSTSCLYVVNPAGYPSGTANGPSVQQDVTSPCTTTYDNCVPNGTTSLTKCPLSGSPTAAYGVLFQALYYICQIDEQRAAAGFGPLILSIGLEAGVRTPVYVQNMSGGDGGPGTIDLAYTASKPGGTNAGYVCGRVPYVWTASYATAYGNAFTALVNYIGAANNYVASRPQLLANGPKLVAAKIDGLNADTAEFALSGSSSIPNMPGTNTPYDWMTDMGGAGISCAYMNTVANGGSNTTAAQHWLDTFGQTIHTTVTFAQAVEEDFGMITGYEYGAMAAASAATPKSVSATFLLAIELRDSATFPDDNCGKANSGQTIYGVGQVGPGQSNSCVVDPPYMTGDTWTTYYPVEAILGLTSNAGYSSGRNAAKAYASFNAQFGFNQLALNTTDLQPYPSVLNMPGPMPGSPPSTTITYWPDQTGCLNSYTQCQVVAMNELPCNLNNPASTPTADLGVLQLLNNYGQSGGGDVNYTIPGVQTLLGSQTAFADVNYCSMSHPNSYDITMQIAANNGSGYIEISPPEATSLNCQPSYATILPSIMSQTNPNCLYGSQ